MKKETKQAVAAIGTTVGLIGAAVLGLKITDAPKEAPPLIEKYVEIDRTRSYAWEEVVQLSAELNAQVQGKKAQVTFKDSK